VTDGRTDGQNYDSQDRASIARAVKTEKKLKVVSKCARVRDEYSSTFDGFVSLTAGDC